MSREQINIDILFEKVIHRMNDDTTFDEIMKNEKKEQIQWGKIKTIKKFLQSSPIEDFIFLLIRIFKEKVPSLTRFEQCLFKERYRHGKNTPIIRDSDIKDANLTYSFGKPTVLIYEQLSFNFSTPQNIVLLKNSVVESLGQIENKVEGNTITVKNSPIAEVQLSELNFTIIMNPDLAVLK